MKKTIGKHHWVVPSDRVRLMETRAETSALDMGRSVIVM
jgi:hypothetical protein